MRSDRGGTALARPAPPGDGPQAAELPVWYLNLDRCADRRRHIEAELARAGLRNVRRVRALDGRRIGDPGAGSIGGVAFENRVDPRAPAADLAATLSHLDIARRMLADPGRPEVVCVVEDDMVFELFDGPAEPRLRRLLAAAPEGWGILQLQCNNTDVLELLALGRAAAPAGRRPFVPRDAIDPVLKAWGAGAYLLSRRGARALAVRFVRRRRLVVAGGSVVAVERFLYRIPGAYLLRDALFTSSPLPSLLGGHHDLVDRESNRLTRRLFPVREAGAPLAAAVLALVSRREGDRRAGAAVAGRLAGRGLERLPRARLCAVLPDDLRDLGGGEVWGVRFENRCRDRGTAAEVAAVLSFLKGVFVQERARLPRAWIAGPFPNAPGVPAAVVSLSLDGARRLLGRTLRRGRFVLEGERPGLGRLLALAGREEDSR